MTKLNVIRFVLLALFASLTACKTAEQPEAASVPIPAAVYVAPTPVLAPAPPPVYVQPDQTLLPGHSSRTTPVPVEPVDVDELGPVWN